jgi:hypothetical protein
MDKKQNPKFDDGIKNQGLAEGRETLPGENPDFKHARHNHEFDIDIEQPGAYRERQDEVAREIENDPGIFEN